MKTFRCAMHMPGSGRGGASIITAPTPELAAERYALSLGYPSLREMARQFGFGMASALDEFVKGLVTETNA